MPRGTSPKHPQKSRRHPQKSRKHPQKSRKHVHECHVHLQIKPVYLHTSLHISAQKSMCVSQIWECHVVLTSNSCRPTYVAHICPQKSTIYQSYLSFFSCLPSEESKRYGGKSSAMQGFKCVHTCTCIYIYVCIYMCICIYVYIYMYIYLYVCVIIYTYIDLCVCVCACLCVCAWVFACACVCVCLRMHDICTYMCLFVCVCIIYMINLCQSTTTTYTQLFQRTSEFLLQKCPTPVCDVYVCISTIFELTAIFRQRKALCLCVDMNRMSYTYPNSELCFILYM